MTNESPRKRPRAARVVMLLGAGLLLLLAIGWTAFEFSPRLLTIDSGPCAAGAIVVLGGNPFDRPLRAAELFAERAAPVVIASGEGDGPEVVRALKQHGVPETVIRLETRSTSTKQNAEFSVALLRQAGITNAIVVTSWYHSRRALKCFQKAAPDLQFYSRPSYYALKRAEWSRTGVSSHIRVEYVKLLGYWIRYGICPC